MTESNLIFERIQNGEIERRGILKKGLTLSNHRDRIKEANKEAPQGFVYVGAWFKKYHGK